MVSVDGSMLLHWLALYKENRKFESLKKSIKDSGACS